MNVKILFNGDPIWGQISISGSLRTSCWIWTGSFNGADPIYKLDGRRLSAARYFWDLFCGPKLRPEDHLTYCQTGNKACVSPLHRRYYRTDLEHLEAYVLRSSNPDACSLWAGSFRNGYPVIRIGGKSRRAHRAYWEALYGEIPAGQVIMHDCDLRSCLVHLRLGSSEENTRDMWRRGRSGLQRRQQREWLNTAAELFPGELLIHATADLY